MIELIDRFVDMLYASRLLESKRVEGAIRSVPRHVFIEQYYAGKKNSRLVKVNPKQPDSKCGRRTRTRGPRLTDG